MKSKVWSQKYPSQVYPISTQFLATSPKSSVTIIINLPCVYASNISIKVYFMQQIEKYSYYSVLCIFTYGIILAILLY